MCDWAHGRRELTRRAWYGIFARELGEGKWWQVAYDLEVSGASVDDFEMGGAANFGIDVDVTLHDIGFNLGTVFDLCLLSF